ncbi:MAG: iron-sulfur cluster assembly scaffold protein [Acidobacteriota bacterium]|nr:iron-sulfur cluster assembly scaffold protein [Acidobacteriota bacterium]
MSFYPEKINEKIRSPRSVDKLASANGVGTGANFVCGTFVRFFLRIETETKEIVEAKYKTGGCGFVIAAAEVLCAQVKGRKLVELHGLDKSILTENVENELGEFPDKRVHCLEICLDSLQSAFANFRAAQIEEFAGEKALICTCFGVSEDTIENLIQEKSLETVEEITANCSAGGGCGSCQPLIQDILDVYWRENF